ncbi:hypothetical protein EVAR_16481_1 [Eumeta japonica]|uniref:Histone-lysine N-methyltransferase SETMAR n=1 Tax=Eumeta variegata TaxID=151549 RepID=A0A4C1UKQ1_EUMVA|nr:hypothetical protein EVAR_16481_1 [Eumeta japonica]
MCGVSLKGKCRNSDVREQCGMKEDLLTRIEKDMLQWFGHLEKMNESKLTKQMCRANMCREKSASADTVGSTAACYVVAQYLRVSSKGCQYCISTLRTAVAIAAVRDAGFEKLDHPSYSHDLTPSDFYLFERLKEYLKGQRFKGVEEVIAEVHTGIFRS